MGQYFPKPFRRFRGNINFKIDLCNYATKTDLKNVIQVDTSSYFKLSEVVKNVVVKKTVYDKLVPKVYIIDSSDFVLKTKYDTDESELEKKIPNVTDFVIEAKLTKLKNKIPDISDLVTKIVLTTVENKIPDISILVKKQSITLKLQKLKINLLIIIMINILQLQSLIS